MWQSFNSTKREHAKIYQKYTWNTRPTNSKTNPPLQYYSTLVQWCTETYIYLQYTVVQYIVCHTVIAVNIYIRYYNVKKGNYLFSSLNLQIMVDTVNLLMFGCTLCPASLMLIPWTRTWSIRVALISSDSTVLCLRWPPRPPLTRTLPLRFLSIVGPHKPVLSELAYMFPHIISHKCDQFWVVVFKWWHPCALIVFDLCHLCSPLCTGASQWKCVGKLCLNRWKVLMVLPKEWLIQSVGSGNWAFGSDNRV